MSGSSKSAGSDLETGVSSRASRRRFTIEYKTWVVQESERLRGSGEVGALLRREGLFASQLAVWRKQYAAGGRDALSQKRGPKAKVDRANSELTRMQKENADCERI